MPSSNRLRTTRRRGRFLVVAALFAGPLSAPAAAQLTDVRTAAPTLASSNSLSNSSIAGQREAEYAALARDVETLDREFSLVKRVEIGRAHV